MSSSFGSVVSLPDLNSEVRSSKSKVETPSLTFSPSSHTIISSTSKVIGRGLTTKLNSVSKLIHPVRLFVTLTYIGVDIDSQCKAEDSFVGDV